MLGRNLAHVQDDVNPHILRMLNDTFSVVAAHILISMRGPHCGDDHLIGYDFIIKYDSRNLGYVNCLLIT